MLTLNTVEKQKDCDIKNEGAVIYKGKIKEIQFCQIGFDRVPFAVLKDKVQGIDKINLKHPYNILILSAYPENEINFTIKGTHVLPLTERDEVVF